MDLPSVATYKSADGTMRPHVGAFWYEVGRMMTLDGQVRVPSLCKLVAGLLTIPCSNADSERGFSMLRKIHTDQRSNLDQSTIIALMSMKFNCDDCYDVQLNDELLSQCKSATTLSLASTSTGH